MQYKGSLIRLKASYQATTYDCLFACTLNFFPQSGVQKHWCVCVCTLLHYVSWFTVQLLIDKKFNENWCILHYQRNGVSVCVSANLNRLTYKIITLIQGQPKSAALYPTMTYLCFISLSLLYHTLLLYNLLYNTMLFFIIPSPCSCQWLICDRAARRWRLISSSWMSTTSSSFTLAFTSPLDSVRPSQSPHTPLDTQYQTIILYTVFATIICQTAK